MSEKQLQESLRTTLRALTGWNEVKVVINDWRILDGSRSAAPYAVIENADTFDSNQMGMMPVINWQIPVTLFVSFTDWQEALNRFRDLRQAAIDEIATSGDFANKYLVNIIRSDGLIGEWKDPYHSEDAMPIYVTQRLILEIEESPECQE